MRLAEIDGKALLRRHGLAVPRGVLLQGEPPAEAAQWSGHVLKAQVLEGGRGKRGLVLRLAGWQALAPARQAIAEALGDGSKPLLLEETVAIAREIYVAVRIDGTGQTLELMIAPQGGQEVEQTEALARIPVGAATRPGDLYPQLAKLFAPDLAARLARYCARLPEIARREDLELLEINPLVLTPDGRLVACDAKLVRDDSAESRHDPEDFPTSRMLAQRAMTPLEREARTLGFHLVEIDGDHGRAIADRPQDCRAPRREGDRVPDRAGVALAGGAGRGAARLDRRRPAAEAPIRRHRSRPRGRPQDERR
jgi:succinyl-CoA synthetase beta subunit